MPLAFIKIFILNIILAISTLIPQSSISIGLVGQPETLLPHEANTDSEEIISDLIFRKLFKYEEGKLMPDLAENYEVSDDKRQYIIKLKDDIYWQDGMPITTNDILYTLTLH